ncbi:hypothetical protein [Nitrospirillum bahiense]|uniref:hypothetical protein n=1 Tax=Nitrospirillum amazonense TaxID=28077 RepID=UPI0011A5822D|nr:hypothetical protein [Nitrospirillum amazonense]
MMKILHNFEKKWRPAMFLSAVFVVSALACTILNQALIGYILLGIGIFLGVLSQAYQLLLPVGACSCPACSYRTAKELGLPAQRHAEAELHCTGLRARIFGLD